MAFVNGYSNYDEICAGNKELKKAHPNTEYILYVYKQYGRSFNYLNNNIYMYVKYT